MNNEKVKEIKECLLWNGDRRLSYTNTDFKKVYVFYDDILTLINELESENERLVKSCKNCHYIKDLEIANGHAKELKDRIAELEKENETKTDTITDLLKKQEFYETEKLKQFAEMLKEKLEEYRLKNEYFTEHEPNNNLWQMNSSVFCIEVTQDGGLVDETLKEFINKGE